jgi:hypothetical protein
MSYTKSEKRALVLKQRQEAKNKKVKKSKAQKEVSE